MSDILEHNSVHFSNENEVLVNELLHLWNHKLQLQITRRNEGEEKSEKDEVK